MTRPQRPASMTLLSTVKTSAASSTAAGRSRTLQSRQTILRSHRTPRRILRILPATIRSAAMELQLWRVGIGSPNDAPSLGCLECDAATNTCVDDPNLGCEPLSGESYCCGKKPDSPKPPDNPPKPPDNPPKPPDTPTNPGNPPPNQQCNDGTAAVARMSRRRPTAKV